MRCRPPRRLALTLCVAALMVSAVLVPSLAGANTSGTLVITSSTVLSEDHDGTIVIGADDVTLDCASHTIAGTGDGHGVSISSHSGVNVRNCTVTGFEQGIAVVHSQGVTLSANLSFDNPGNGLYVVGSSDTTLSHNFSTGNGANGLHIDASEWTTVSSNRFESCGGVGIALTDSTDSTVEMNSTKRNGEGILILASAGNGFTANTVTANAGAGILLADGATANTFRRNRVSKNGLPDVANGFHLSGSSFNRFVENSSHHNGNDGFVVEGGSNGNVFLRNEAHDSVSGFSIQGGSSDNVLGDNVVQFNGTGFYLVDAHHNILRDNDASANQGDGIYVESSTRNEFTGNEVVANGIPDSGGHGMILVGGSSYNTLRFNLVTGSASTGIPIIGSSWNLIQGNVSSFNDAGFDIVNSAHNTIRANRAMQNGQFGFRVTQPESSDNLITLNVACRNGLLDALEEDAGLGNVWRANHFCTSST